MKTIKYIAAFVCSAFLMTSCLDQFKNLNTDPEQLGSADPCSVFAGATLNFNNCSRAHLTAKYSGVMINMQYLVPTGGPTGDAYIMTSKATRTEPYSPQYNTYYSSNGDGYGAFGLRLDNLINDVIPSRPNPDEYKEISAIAGILMAYEQWIILDTYGAAPITDAFKADEGLRTPAYDLYQKGLDGQPMYKTIDNNVKLCVAALKESKNVTQANLGKQDFFYGGDVAKWAKFGNTLRVLMAQRLEKADNTFYTSVINEVLTDANNIISSNDESCIYNHPNDYGNNTDDIQDITSRYCAAASFVNYLLATNDPRLPILVRRNGFGDDNLGSENNQYFDFLKGAEPDWATKYAGYLGRYVGMTADPAKKPEKGNAVEFQYKEETTDKTGQVYYASQIESRYYVKNGGIRGNNNMPVRYIEDAAYIVNQDEIHCFNPILTYPQTCLMLAEIALKKGSAVAGHSAQDWFKAGIQASAEQYAKWAADMKVVAQVNEAAPSYNPVTAEKITAFVNQSIFGEVSLEKIISQQWINLYMQPEEMWANWKRTGYPAFKNDPVPENGVAFFETVHASAADATELVIPRRNTLPTPNTLNEENFKKAVAGLKEDAKYGSAEDRTEGRIWWDMNGMN